MGYIISGVRFSGNPVLRKNKKGGKDTNDMKDTKKWVALVLILGVLAFIGFMIGCGATTTGTGTTTTTVAISSVAINGTVAVSTSDLAQLGVSALSPVDLAKNMKYLTSKGFSAASVKALNLVPMAAGDATVTIGTLNADGTMTAVATADVAADGTYSIVMPEYYTNKAYEAIITKTSGSKKLEIKTVFGKPVDGAISGTDAAASPQTTTFVEMIIQNVIKAIGSGDVDADTITNVKAAVLSVLNDLIADGTINVSTVKDADDTNGATLSAAKQAALNDLILQKLDAIKGATQLNTALSASDLDTARGAIKNIFKGLMDGDDRGAPDEMVNAFAQAYLDGNTFKTSQIAPALNESLYSSGGSEIAGSFTTAQIATQIKHMLQGILGGTATDAPDNIRYVVELAFPKDTWASATISADTAFTVPQGILLVGISEKLAHEVNAFVNHLKLAYKLGLMSTDVSGIKIMHAEVIVKTVEDFSAFSGGEGGEPVKVKALEAFVEFGDMMNMSTVLTGYTVTLTYPTASGNKTVTLSENQFSLSSTKPSAKSARVYTEEQMGPPPGMKMVRLDAWGNSDNRVSDVTSGTVTITLKNSSGTTVDTKTRTIPDIDLSTASVTLNVPKEVWIDHIANMTKFTVNSKPTMNWTTGTLPTAPAGYRLGYSINCIKGQVEKFAGGGMGFMANWGDPNSRVFDSWEKRKFLPAESGETFNFLLPTTLGTAGIYEFGVGVVLIDKKTGFPAVEGPHAGGIFIVGELAQAITDPTALAEFQNEFVEVDISTRPLTLEGKVHADVLAEPHFTGGTLKIALVRPSFNKTTGVFSQTLVAGVTPVNLTTVAGQTYKTFSLKFNGSVFSANYGPYEVILWNDSDNDGTFDEYEPREHAQKMIDHQSFGTRVHWSGGGDELVNSQTDFDIKFYGDSF